MSREAMQQALEALESSRWSHHYCEDTWYSCPQHEGGCANEAEGDECNCGADKANEKIDQAITAIKQALAEPEQEPVATDWERIARVQDAKLRAVCDEPGGFEKLCEVMDRYKRTAPTPRKPLTDEEIAEASAGVLGLPHEIKVELARAIERAHGLGEQK